jgi:hypothetical protein
MLIFAMDGPLCWLRIDTTSLALMMPSGAVHPINRVCRPRRPFPLRSISGLLANRRKWDGSAALPPQQVSECAGALKPKETAVARLNGLRNCHLICKRSYGPLLSA